MSVKFNQPDEGLTRSGSYFAPGSDWSILIWTNSRSYTAAQYGTLYYFGDGTYGTPYVAIYLDAAGITAEAFNGIATYGTITIAYDYEIWKSFALTYNSATTTLSLLINGVIVGTAVINLGIIVFPSNTEYLLTDTTGDTDLLGGIEVFNVMTFQSLLTATQITAQVFTTTILTGTLLTFTPLTNDTDLADDSGNGRNWTTIGSGSSLVSPTLVPTATANIAATSAYELGSLPKTIIQNCRPAGTTLTKWFKCTPGLGEVGMFGLGDTTPGYSVNTSVYEGPAGAPSPLLGGISGLLVPTQWPSEAATEYFIRALAVDATDNPAFLVLNLQLHISTPVLAGDILVNDDSPGFPVAILSASENYIVKRFIQPFPAGEEGDILPNGNMLLEDADGDQIKSFRANFNIIASIPNPAGTTVGSIRSNRGLNNFYVAYEDAPAAVTVYTINGQGTTLSSLIATLTGTSAIGGMAASNNGGILYYAKAPANEPIRTWNLSTNLAGANLLAAVPNYQTRAILVLPDDSLLISYYRGGIDTYVKHVDSTGVTLHTYNYGADNISNPRLCFWLNNLSFVIWLQRGSPNIGVMRFVRTQISDGVALFTRDHENFEAGVYQIDPASPPRARYGCSFSCPMFVLTASAQPEFRSGLYKIVPTASNSGSVKLTHDELYEDDGLTENVKIPDPFADIYLIGDE